MKRYSFVLVFLAILSGCVSKAPICQPYQEIIADDRVFCVLSLNQILSDINRYNEALVDVTGYIEPNDLPGVMGFRSQSVVGPILLGETVFLRNYEKNRVKKVGFYRVRGIFSAETGSIDVEYIEFWKPDSVQWSPNEGW